MSVENIGVFETLGQIPRQKKIVLVDPLQRQLLTSGKVLKGLDKGYKVFQEE